MELWVALLLLLLFAGILITLIFVRRRAKPRWMLPAIVALSVISLALLIYILLTFLLLGAV